MTLKRLDSKYHYPINPNPESDLKRRETVVKALVTLGIPNAEQCVEGRRQWPKGYTAEEAIRAYNRGLTEWNTGQTGFSGGVGSGAGLGTGGVP